MKNAKRMIVSTIIFSILFCFVLKTPAEAAYKVSFEVFSDVAFLVNTDTGDVIYEKNPDKQIYPASLTKIMTALVAIENVKDLKGTMVTAPTYVYDEFYGIGVSTADIQAGETISMLDLLYALILPSACEAGSIIADYVGDGSISTFVDVMNETAKKLGANNTNFTNAHGLFHEDQKTTARDMAIITQAALKYPVFAEISNTPIYNMPSTPFHPSKWRVIHTNYMMRPTPGWERYYYEYVKGVKTGSIPQVGKNLSSTASKDGYNYLLITMGAPNTDKDGNFWPSGTNKAFEDAIALYNWAFSNFTQQKLLKQNEFVEEVPVRLGLEQDYVTLISESDVYALLPNDVQISAIQKVRNLPEQVTAPVKQGTVLGTLELKLAGETISTVNLVVSQGVERNEMLYWIDICLNFLKQPLVIALLVVLMLLVLLFMIVMLRFKRMKRRHNQRLRARIK